MASSDRPEIFSAREHYIRSRYRRSVSLLFISFIVCFSTRFTSYYWMCSILFDTNTINHLHQTNIKDILDIRTSAILFSRPRTLVSTLDSPWKLSNTSRNNSIPPSSRKTLHVTALSSVRFHRALNVNFIVISTIRDSTFDLTIASSFSMYCGCAPSMDVSSVEIFAANIEQIATDIRFMDASSNVDKQFITNLAHLLNQKQPFSSVCTPSEYSFYIHCTEISIPVQRRYNIVNLLGSYRTCEKIKPM